MFRTSGIDIGTTFVTVYRQGTGVTTRTRHEGKIIDTIYSILNQLDDSDYLVFTGKAGKDPAQRLKATYLEEAVALSYLLAEDDPFNGDNGRIVDIGASSLTLYTVSGGKVTDIAQNTLCAAGTGLFLEEQARRLDMDLEGRGALTIDEPPLIASRCTVFAKSDLIHHQQEGRGKDEMWAGLCRSLVVSAVNTLFRGEELKGKIMLCGGVSLNREVVRWFEKLYPRVDWIIPENSEAIIAAGAAAAPGKTKSELPDLPENSHKEFQRMPPLTLIRSQYPEMPEPALDEYDNEIRVHESPEQVESVIFGMDIGSTSTKLAVLDAGTRQPILDIYGRTAGEPIEAARKIFSSYYNITGERDIPVKAFGTTGSGRYLVGKIFGADHIVNEITAHGRGTRHFFPEVETIFEIGGQDAKYIRLKDGYVTDVNMNYVCAAGTGSFVEEQARKLGVAVQDIGGITAGIAPPITSDRCTVFMEQDLGDLLKEGFNREEALASVLYSVIRNYLNRVVGNRYISEKAIFFQGATARNRGLVAAMENLLGVEVNVSPHCHLMGAVGAALIAGEQTGVSTFVGRESLSLAVSTRTETCKLCRNFCRVNYISRSGGDEFSWGYQCGRDPEEKHRKEIPQFGLFKQKEKLFNKNEKPKYHRGTVTIVNALTNHTFYPLWKHFFNRLGIQVRTTGPTVSEIKKYAASVASADFCFPAKVVPGHVVKALQYEDPVFLPHMIAERGSIPTAHSYFCPYMQTAPSVVRATLARNNMPAHQLITPVIDFRRSFKEVASDLFQSLQKNFPFKRKEVLNALKEAHRYWEAQTVELERQGARLLEKMEKNGQPVFLLVGRPYNLHDRGLNLGIPEKLASMGYTVIPLDMLDVKEEIKSLSKGNFHNLFWQYGQKIMAALHKIGKMKHIFPVYLTNFNCGPDSFLLNYAETELKGKPMLVLELDEHDSDGGYLTRLEAFLDVVHAYSEPISKANQMPQIYTAKRQPDLNGTVWIPPMHPVGKDLFAAAFRGYGYRSESLPLEDEEALEAGKKRLRGGECLPMALTLGAFLKALEKEKKNSRHILFIPTTGGPCRFGQYNMLDRIVFDNMGLKNVDILSPSSMNSYQGLEDSLRRYLMHVIMASDILFKMRCRVKPYERTGGDTEEIYEKSIKRLVRVIERKGNVKKAIKEIAATFASVNTTNERKPLVGIVGEIYVRCNEFSNGNLVEVIESSGGEAWLTPVHEWILYVSCLNTEMERSRPLNLLKRGETLLTDIFFRTTEKAYYQAAGEVLADRHEPPIKDVVEAGAEYLPLDFQGEAILTIGRALQFARLGADMVVNTAPFGCMPGTLSSSILLEIKEKFKIPFVSLFYDGDIDVNQKVAALLKTIHSVEFKFNEARIDGAVEKRDAARSF